MKFFHSLILLCLFLPAFSQGNQYLENSSWVNGHYSLKFPQGVPPQMTLDWTRKYCTGTSDTVINGENYIQLFDCGAGQNYRGALRADTLRWYFVARDSLSEMLLYDFSLEPGDTLSEPVFTEHFFSPSNAPYVCRAVDTIVVNGKTRRRLLMGGGNGYWIEGVGCSQGLLWDSEPNISGFALNLECYDRQDSVGYSSPDYDNQADPRVSGCDLSFSLPESLPSGGLTVYPNPSSGEFTLRFPNFNGKLAVSVFSLDGKKLFATEADQPELKLALNLPGGVYLLRYEGRSSGGSELLKISK